MTLLLGKWRIKNHGNGGYVVQKKIGKQWKESAYFSTLQAAAIHLHDSRVNDETITLIIDTSNDVAAAIARAELVTRMESIRDEILGVLGSA